MKKAVENPITGPILKQITDNDAAQQADLNQRLNLPESQPDLMHDSGEGYNANFVFPQQ